MQNKRNKHRANKMKGKNMTIRLDYELWLKIRKWPGVHWPAVCRRAMKFITQSLEENNLNKQISALQLLISEEAKEWQKKDTKTS